jgi:hypothetical protein
VIWGKTFFDCFTQDSRWEMSSARWALSHGVVAVSRRGMEMELSAAGGDRRCVGSSGWVGLPSQVCLSGLTFHKSWLGDRVRVAGLDPCWAGCVALVLDWHEKSLGQGKEKCLAGCAWEES